MTASLPTPNLVGELVLGDVCGKAAASGGPGVSDRTRSVGLPSGVRYTGREVTVPEDRAVFDRPR